MYIFFLKGKTKEEIISNVLIYEHGFHSYNDFLNSDLSNEEKLQIHLKTLRYYKNQKVDDRWLWINSKVKHKKLEKEFENVTHLMGSSDEKNRILALELCKNLFEFNRYEVGWLMIHHFYYSETSNHHYRMKTWELNNSKIIQKIDPTGISTIHHKKNSKSMAQRISTLMAYDDGRYIPRLLDNFFINLK